MGSWGQSVLKEGDGCDQSGERSLTNNRDSSGVFWVDPPASLPSFKVVLVGDDRVGKTALIKRHLTGQFSETYQATTGVDVTPLKFHTSEGPVELRVWDCAGQEKLRGFGDAYYIQAEAAIIAFDLTSRITFKNVRKWRREVLRVADAIPTVLIGCKMDLEVQRQVRPTEHHQHLLQYYDVSAKTNWNYVKPFLFLIRKLLGKPGLLFVESPSSSSSDTLTPASIPSPAPSPQCTVVIHDPSLQAALPRLGPHLQALSDKQHNPAVRSIVEAYLLNDDLDDFVDSLQILLSL